MNIYMYNAQFGDCFLIKNDGSSLMVDFGIYRRCLTRKVVRYVVPSAVNTSTVYSSTGKPIAYDRDCVYKDIIKQISKETSKNFLLTHYHEDHFSGLLYMYNNQKSVINPNFGIIYLPDVWSYGEVSNKIVSLILLEQLLKKATIGGKITLLELVKYVCKGTHSVKLIKRGSKFEGDRYTALWPDMVNIGYRAATGVIPQIEQTDSSLSKWLNRVEGISAELVELMQNIEEADRLPIQDVDSKCERLTMDANNIAREIESSINADLALKSVVNNAIPKLNDFGNEISIVFHNTWSGEENLLFTGDITKRPFTLIEKGYGSLMLHEHYKYIKLPHHGTEPHFYDFGKFRPQYLMFPNGKVFGVKANAKTGKMGFQISEKYKDVINWTSPPYVSTKVFCANKNWCEMSQWTSTGTIQCNCGAGECNIIFPEVYREVK